MGIFGSFRSPLKSFYPRSAYTDAFVPISDANALREILRYWSGHIKNHIPELDGTNRPDVFFEKYNFVMDNIEKCTIASPFSKIKKANFQKQLQQWEQHREDEAAKFLERYFTTVQARNSSYKSPEARQVVASEFRFSLAPHMEKLTPKLQQQVEEYCQRLLKAE